MSLVIIDKLYKDNQELTEYLQRKGEISFKSQFDDTFKKVLLLACASNLEHQVNTILAEYAEKATNHCVPLVSFIKNKAITRQFHTYFDWKGTNANQFFGLFGDEMGTQIKSHTSSNEVLSQGIRAFLEIGNLRNTMVHEDYISFYLDKTAEEVYSLYIKSQAFITYLETTLFATLPNY